MLIVQNKSGQLANRIFAFSHFIANALEHGYPLKNPTFDEYVDLFPKFRNDDFGGSDISTRISPFTGFTSFKLITSALSHFLPKSPWHEFIKSPPDGSVVDMNAPSFLGKVKSGKVIFARGWGFRDAANHTKHRDTLVELFSPDPTVVEWADRIIGPARESGDKLIGVHIRRGDYQQWEGGRYYYGNETYFRWMKDLEEELKSTGNGCTFAVCSNEPLSASDFPGLTVLLPKGDLLQDLHLLSKCDYIVGPPSTYSMWASFSGDVPLRHMTNESDEISLAEFAIHRER